MKRKTIISKSSFTDNSKYWRGIKMDRLQIIRNNQHLKRLLLDECDIYFYDHIREVQFSNNNEEYSLACQAFAQDGSGGEIGFIGSEGQVGRDENRLELLCFKSWRQPRLRKASKCVLTCLTFSSVNSLAMFFQML